MFKSNIFPRRPQANSGREKHTTGTSTSETKALESRKAGRGSPGCVQGLLSKPRAGVPAASTRRCMRETRAAPPAALSLVRVGTRLLGESGPPKTGWLPRSRDRRGGSRARGWHCRAAASAPGRPRPGRVGRPPGPQRRAQRQPFAHPPRLASGPADLPCCRSGSERSVLPRGAFLLGPERAVQRRLRVSRPRAASATRSRPRPSLEPEPAPTAQEAPSPPRLGARRLAGSPGGVFGPRLG